MATTRNSRRNTAEYQRFPHIISRCRDRATAIREAGGTPRSSRAT